MPERPWSPEQIELAKAKLNTAYQVVSQHASKGIVPFLNQIIIPTGGDAKPFRDVADSWQWLLAKKLSSAIETVGGLREEHDGPRFFFLVLPKGSNKTGLIAWLESWLLAFSRRGIAGYAASGDRDQAALLLESMQKLADLNPWLSQLLYLKNYQVKGQRGSNIKIISADAKTSHGPTPDIIVVDEVTWWKDRALYDSLNASRIKNKKCVFIVISNAGILGTWQHEALEAAKKNKKDWYTYEAPGPIASWMTAEDIASLRLELPPMEAARMLDNLWLDSSESCGFVTKEEVGACSQLGKDLNLTVRYSGRSPYVYLASIDYGPVRDRTVCCVVHQEGELVIVDRMDVYQGSKKARVPVERVENWIVEVNNNYKLGGVVCDPAGLESTCQKFEKIMNFMRFEARGGKGNAAIFHALRSAIVNKRVTWFPGCGSVIVDGHEHTIEQELVELIVRKLGYGYRIDTLNAKHHDDRSVALGQALVQCYTQPLKQNLYKGSYQEDSLWF